MMRFIFIFYCCVAFADKQFVIVVPSYNNADWCEKNLNSFIAQRYRNYRIVYVNDASTDKTGELVENFLISNGVDYSVVSFKENGDISRDTASFAECANRNKSFFTLVNNEIRSGSLANLYRAIHSCDDCEIAVLVDGDDWLAGDHVLEELNSLYTHRNILLTHGTLRESPTELVTWSEPIPDGIIHRNAFRFIKCPSHLRTFYSYLFKKIKLEDLLFDGKFFQMTGDMALMFPLCEMAGERHAFIPQVNYIYNMKNPLNDNKIDARLQRYLEIMVRNKHRYKRLPDYEIPHFMD